MTAQPAELVLSLLLDAEEAPPAAVRATWRSLVAQDDERWELLVHGPELERMAKDPRVRFVASGETDTALRLDTLLSAARGTFVSVIDPGAELAVQTVGAIGGRRDHYSDVSVIVTDEVVERWDRPGLELRRKPVWSPELLRHCPYPERLTAVARELAERVGGFRSGFAGAHEHDLLLRVAETRPRAVRVAELLHRSKGRPAPERGSDRALGHVRAVQEHLDRKGHGASAAPGPVAGTVAVDRRLPVGSTVSVVIATSGASGLVWGDREWHAVGAAESVLAASAPGSVDVTIAHHEELPADLLRRLRELGPEVRLVRVPGSGGQSRLRNRAVVQSSGEFVVALDERVRVQGADFFDQLLAPLLEGDIGVTGPRILTAGGFHAGAGVATYADRAEPMFLDRFDGDSDNPVQLSVSRECSAVLAACVALNRKTFFAAGGFNERMTHFHTVDLSAKVARLGLSTVWVRPAVARWFPTRASQDIRVVGDIKSPERYRLESRWHLPDLDPFEPVYGERLVLKNKLEAIEHDIADMVKPSTSRATTRRPARRLSRRVLLLNRLD